ncbi:MAG: hypothetical protein ACYCOO_06565 [Chitinophagaceae bacterium]
MEQEVTRRFLDFFHYLKSQHKVKSASSFATQLGVSTSMMTELKKGRSQLGLKTLQQTVLLYRELDPHWLLTGEGSMVRSLLTGPRSQPSSYGGDSSFYPPSAWAEEEKQYGNPDPRERLMAAKEELIRTQQTTIDNQQETIRSLLKALEKLSPP